MSNSWLLGSLGPALLLIGYGVFKTRGSWGTPALWMGFVTGAGAGVLAMGAEMLLMRLFGVGAIPTAATSPADAMLNGFVVAAFSEETLKLGALIVVIIVSMDGRRLQDMLLVAIGVAMGFASLENMLYLLKAGSHVGAIAMLRGSSAVPVHGICGLLMGAIVIGMIANNVSRVAGLALALLVPLALHGTYDTLLFLSGPGVVNWRMPVTVCVMLGGGLLAVMLCNTALEVAGDIDGWEAEGYSPLAGLIRWLVKKATRYYVGMLFIPVILGGFQPAMFWSAAFLAVLPVVLALDVVFTKRLETRSAMA